MGVVLALILQLVKLCIISIVLAFQGSQGSLISPSPASLPVIYPSGEAPAPIHHGLSWGSSPPKLPSDQNGFGISPSPETIPVDTSRSEAPGSLHPRKPWRTIAPSPPEVPNGSFLPSPVTLPPPTSAPTPQKMKGFESSISPIPSTSTITSSPPNNVVHVPATAEGNVPSFIQPSPTQSKLPDVRPPVSTPIAPAPIEIPSGNLPKISPVSQPIEHGILPPTIDERNKSHKPEPALPVPIPSTKLPKISPTENGSLPDGEGANNSRIPEPISPAPSSAHNARQFHHAPEPLVSSPKSPFHKDYPSASSPSTTFYKHHHTRNTMSPGPAPSSRKHQDEPSPPSLLPVRHHDPPPMNAGSSVSPSTFPIQSPVSQVSPAPSPSFKIPHHSTKTPFHHLKVYPSWPSSKSPKKPVLPHVQPLPPPPPNEDCISLVCSDPCTSTPPGAPCKCVLPMKVGLRLSVSLYTFFPLVSEFASEIATGVFMKQSQVRIMGADAANQQPDKTVVFIDLVPLGEKFDNTTAFLTSKRFWHKQIVIKTSYFGDYDLLYVSYPGLPPSPPLPPSSITIIDGGPYLNGGNNGRTIKPLGVNVLKSQRKGGLSKGIIAIIALSVFLVVVLCSAVAMALFKFRDRASQPTSTPRVLSPSLTKAPGAAGSLVGGGLASALTSFGSSIAAYTGSAKTFSMNDIEKATDNFHASRVLGEGGFGRVYSGILEDGTKVAVKVLKREDHHGDREFLSEVEMLSRLHHRNLVKLIGICTEVNFRCLVYELIPNGSVESHLHGVDKENGQLDWSARIKIALGAARGLAYLHEDSSPHVIHRDFKSSNILLENDFTPKVSDFGLARTAADEENRHISTQVMGTFGYVAPEYAMTGHLLVKSDVYSYGVVLLELLTGRKPVDMSRPPGQENLVAWARPLLSSEEGLEAMIDPSLRPDVPSDSVAKVAAIASMCVQPEVSDRPFMGEVVQALKLVCNECDEAREAGSSSSSVDLSTSRQVSQNFQGQFSATNFDSGVDNEIRLLASELFSSSARYERLVSGSFRRHSYSGPLNIGRSKGLWQLIRKFSGGSVSEHGIMFKM